MVTADYGKGEYIFSLSKQLQDIASNWGVKEM